MKIVTAKLSPRAVFTESRQYGILNYDKDNLYPQNVDMIIGGSGTASSCIEALQKFILGKGFANGNSIVVNDLGYATVTLYDLLSQVTKDFAKFNGFAIHVNYNAKYQPRNYSHVPFEFCRLGVPDDEKYVGKIAVYDNWDRSNPRGRIMKSDIDWINRFNPNPDVVKRQVELAGGWRRYKGQIFYVSTAGLNMYPKTVLDPVLEDVETDSMIKTSKYKSIMNNFSAGHILVHRGIFESEPERKAFVDGLKEFQGPEHDGSIMLIETELEEQEPKLLPIRSNEPSERFKYTEKSIQDNIRKQVKVPPVIIGDLIAGRLGTAEEIYDATKLYNIFTEDERMTVSTSFAKVFAGFPPTQSADFTIIPIEFFKESDILQRKHSTYAIQPEEEE